MCRDNYLSLREEWTVGEALAHLRKAAKHNHIFYLYIVDGAGRLHGTVSLRHLLIAKDDQKLGAISSPKVVTLPENCPLAYAYQMFSENRFLSLPVVDAYGVLKGVVQAHELTDEFGKGTEGLFEERSRGELFELLGIQAEDASQGPVGVAGGRLPWLLVNIIGGSISALFIHKLGGNLKNAVEFLAFVPILLIVSESIGMQTASLVIANLHGSASRRRAREVLKRELVVAALLGIACAVIVAGAVALWKGFGPIAAAIALTVLFGAIFVAGLGNAIPNLFHRLRVDPRVAAGPVVLALADCLTLLFYLLVALAVTR